MTVRYPRLTACLVLVAVSMLAGRTSGAAPAQNLDELLHEVKQSGIAESKLNKAREAEFISNRAQQQSLLDQARARLQLEQARSDALRAQFDTNEHRLTGQETVLQGRLGDLGELFAVARQVAGDTAAILDDSLVSAQYRDRDDVLLKISNNKSLPSIPELEELWYRMQQEMTESGKVVQYTGRVIEPDGREVQKTITRVGVFNAVADGKFLRYPGSEFDQFFEIPRQPEARYQAMARNLQQAEQGYTAMAVDPSRGAILSLLVQAPSFQERIEQGKVIGYIIIVLGIFGLGLGVVRLVVLAMTGARVSKQLETTTTPLSGNPLGRVLAVYFENTRVDTEVLERKLDEAIIKELPALNRGLSVVKILAVTAPLLGLLGTVIGMIETFQSITLFGTGDPKLMAGGISQALMTTVLGLVAAIPLTFIHALVSSRSRFITQILEEQSAGFIARHAEKIE